MKHDQKRDGKQRDQTFIDALFNTLNHKKEELLNIDTAYDDLDKLKKQLSTPGKKMLCQRD